MSSTCHLSASILRSLPSLVPTRLHKQTYLDHLGYHRAVQNGTLQTGKPQAMGLSSLAATIAQLLDPIPWDGSTFTSICSTMGAHPGRHQVSPGPAV